ncbi:MAG TPA: hypothetical protein VJT71_18495 [Pyrinomonadaceae bacterium]|nr:hypothetical protein [Pyrinomonadaceae bacterium]
MLIRLLFFAYIVCFAIPAFAQPGPYGLPSNATIVETRVLPPAAHANRMLVVWMLNPRKNPTNYPPDEIYSCPEQTRGSHYSGVTRVSLIDSATRKVIYTLKISADESEEDSFDLPYAIRKGYYYRVPARVKTGIEAKPNLIWLRDYNGDGQALEFAFFDALACMGLQTTLIGYSRKQDRVIQYPISLEVTEGAKRSTTVTFWADYLFSSKPARPGFWKYEIDYRGRGGSLDKWEVRYNPSREQFEAKLNMIPGE